MKNLLFAVVALIMLTSVSSAQMGRRANRGYSQPRQGIFSRLIEMERAKNAWIRDRFFRR